MDYCGCCGETWEECLCPAGPTEDFNECLRRWNSGSCDGRHPTPQADQQLNLLGPSLAPRLQGF